AVAHERCGAVDAGGAAAPGSDRAGPVHEYGRRRRPRGLPAFHGRRRRPVRRARARVVGADSGRADHRRPEPGRAGGGRPPGGVHRRRGRRGRRGLSGPAFCAGTHRNASSCPPRAAARGADAWLPAPDPGKKSVACHYRNPRTMLPAVALIGRPNVGKSTLFNRLTRSRDALVADYPGVTRDRRYGYARFGDRPYLVIDTGGLGADGSLAPLIEKQVDAALEQADAVILVVD